MKQQLALIARFMVVGVTISFITHQFGDCIVQALSPIYEWAIKQLDYRLDLVLLKITTEHQQQSLSFTTTLSQPFMLGIDLISPQHALPSGGSMPLGNVMLPVVLIMTIILVWPLTVNQNNTTKLKRYTIIASTYLLRMVLALPLTLVVLLLDMPIQLLKLSWEGINELLNLSIRHQLEYFSYWSDFLNGGGLMAISIAAGLLAIGVANLLLRSNTKISD